MLKFSFIIFFLNVSLFQNRAFFLRNFFGSNVTRSRHSKVSGSPQDPAATGGREALNTAPAIPQAGGESAGMRQRVIS